MKSFCCVMVCLLSVVACASPVTVTHGYFDITFYNTGDTNGYTTGQQDWTSQQIADVTASVDAWADNIANTPGRQIRMHLFWEEMDSSSSTVLGGSASYRTWDGDTVWNFGEYVWKEGIDPGSTSYGFDTVLRYDITGGGSSWNFGSGTPASNQIDFRSVLTHELGHSLGFSTAYDYFFDRWGIWTGSSYDGITDWDRNLVDSAGNKPLNGTTGTPGNFNEFDNPVYWDGAAATAIYGDLIPIYAPSVWNRGSSLAHLDETFLGDYLMSPAIATGQTTRSVSDLEWAMMTDMGWQIVPEPATLLLLGLGGLILRKRRNRLADRHNCTRRG